jgi:16S rRNA processing protein RimM
VSDVRILEVGRVGRAHGLRGEVVVRFLAGRPERTAPGSAFDARFERADPPHRSSRRLVVAESRRHQQRWLVRFEGVDDRDAAAALTGAVLYAPELPGHDEELWVHDVVGAAVVDTRGHPIGTVAAVEANPAHDLLVLDGGALVPVAFVVDHGTDEAGARRVVVDLPDGLLDL